MSTHELLGQEIEIDLEDDEIVTGLVVLVCTEGLRFRYSIPTGRIKAEGMIFNAYHAAASDMTDSEE